MFLFVTVIWVNMAILSYRRRYFVLSWVFPSVDYPKLFYLIQMLLAISFRICDDDYGSGSNYATLYFSLKIISGSLNVITDLEMEFFFTKTLSSRGKKLWIRNATLSVIFMILPWVRLVPTCYGSTVRTGTSL